MVPECIQPALKVIFKEVKQKLTSTLPSTGLKPFFMVTADKSTINRRTCQTILISFIFQGEKTVVPIGAPVVYTGAEGGCSEELAFQICNSIKKNLQISDGDLKMIAGKWKLYITRFIL